MSVPESVLAAFGACGGRLTALPGGQEVSVLCDDRIVFKPTTNPVESDWLAQVLSSLAAKATRQDLFRVPEQLRSQPDGNFVFQGWTATKYLADTITSPVEGRWAEHLTTVRAFNRALKELELPRPEFLDKIINPWKLADQVVWGDRSPDSISVHQHLRQAYDELMRLRRDDFVFSQRPQIIHGDMSGNVLLPRSKPSIELPAVIDFSPYFRPAAFAEAMVVADAFIDHQLVDGEAWPGFVTECGFNTPEGWQLVVRAVLFRLVAIGEVRRGLNISLDFKWRYESAAASAKIAIEQVEDFGKE